MHLLRVLIPIIKYINSCVKFIPVTSVISNNLHHSDDIQQLSILISSKKNTAELMKIDSHTLVLTMKGKTLIIRKI